MLQLIKVDLEEIAVVQVLGGRVQATNSAGPCWLT